MKNQRLTSKFRLVVLDETPYWSEDIRKEAGKIERVYLYDERVQTFMCEMTPSYRLIPLYLNTENTVSDEIHEVMIGEGQEETYVHVASVDAMTTIDLRKRVDNVRFTNSDSDLYNRAIERAVEELQANHPI